MLHALDIGFFVFHSAVILINLLGWIPRRTRRLHLAVLALTAFSWFALGPLLGYSIGYCFCTDWHWQVRRALGHHDPASYIELLFSVGGLGVSTGTAATLAYGGFGLALLGAVLVHARGMRARLRRGSAPPRQKM